MFEWNEWKILDNPQTWLSAKAYTLLRVFHMSSSTSDMSLICVRFLILCSNEQMQSNSSLTSSDAIEFHKYADFIRHHRYWLVLLVIAIIRNRRWWISSYFNNITLFSWNNIRHVSRYCFIDKTWNLCTSDALHSI